MKRKTSKLKGELLDAAVAKAEGILVTEADEHPDQPGYYKKTREEWDDHIVRWYGSDGEEGGWETMRAWGSPSTKWNDAGPIIERERISIKQAVDGSCYAYFEDKDDTASGPSVLIAAMRAYVASKLGEEVDL